MTKLADIKGITKPVLSGLHKLGIHDVQGLLLHMPLRYVDETHISAVRELRLGEQAQVEGEIIHLEVNYKPRKSLIARLSDGTGDIFLRFLNFYPSQIAALKEGTRIRALGDVRHGYFGYEMVHPQTRAVRETTAVKQTLTPVYPTTAGLSQPSIRKWVTWALSNGDVSETLPQEIYAKQTPSFKASLEFLHNPPPGANLQAMENRSNLEWRRLALDELISQQLSMRQHYAKRLELGAPVLKHSATLIPQLLSTLPFGLTNAQQRVVKEISQDLSRPYPMQRLLQGDVGSGKTIVAMLAALQAIENGYQVAIMAPTEILAEQHYQKCCIG